MRQFVQIIYRNIAANGFGHGKYPFVGVFDDQIYQVVVAELFQPRNFDVIQARFQAPDSFQQSFLEGPADTHDLARGFHLRIQLSGSFGKLIEGEARHLADDIIQSRFERRIAVRQFYFVQSQAASYLCRNARYRIAAGFRSQSAAAGNSGIDFYDVITEAERIQCELHVATALDTQSANDFQRGASKHLVFLIGQRLAGRDDYRIARMHADGIQVFHTANGDGVIVRVAHDLEFYLLIALYRFFDQHLSHRGKL